MKKSLYQSILAMLLSIVTLAPVANPVAMVAQIEYEPDSFVEELEEPDESDNAGQGKDIPDLEDVISNEDEENEEETNKNDSGEKDAEEAENENSSEDQIESADVDENEVTYKWRGFDDQTAEIYDISCDKENWIIRIPDEVDGYKITENCSAFFINSVSASVFFPFVIQLYSCVFFRFFRLARCSSI